MKCLIKKRLPVVICLIICQFVGAQSLNKTYLLYISNYHQLAEKQQKKYGIPASITLAQGLLESSAGQSALTRASNNHFGIKCNGWNGEGVYFDDDRKNECFRKYDQPDDSYEDHSLFLKNRNRYSFLFDLKSTDYQGWAFGLKKAGYATDPAYAYKLISIIEDYSLHKFDLDQKKSVLESVFRPDKIVKRLVACIGVINSSTNHEIQKTNGVRYVETKVGDTYGSLADEFCLRKQRLLDYNDAIADSAPTPGTKIYISPKKRKASKQFLTHTVEAGESMYSISQRYAIKVERLYKMNNMPYSEGAKTGQVLKLR